MVIVVVNSHCGSRRRGRCGSHSDMVISSTLPSLSFSLAYLLNVICVLMFPQQCYTTCCKSYLSRHCVWEMSAMSTQFTVCVSGSGTHCKMSRACWSWSQLERNTNEAGCVQSRLQCNMVNRRLLRPRVSSSPSTASLCQVLWHVRRAGT